MGIERGEVGVVGGVRVAALSLCVFFNRLGPGLNRGPVPASFFKMDELRLF